MANDQLLFIGQKAFIEKDGKILILTDAILGLDLPGGKIQEGELDFKKALTREVEEETNLKIKILDPFTTWYYEIPNNKKHPSGGKKIFMVGYRCKYVSGKIKLSDEHNAFYWVDKNNYKKLDKEWNMFPAIEKYFSEK
jgi:8-oxo-dGTP pyrophosphatase MutT (NUDIX family)